MNDSQNFDELLEHYLGDNASPDERTELMKMIKSGDYDDTLKQKIDEVLAKRDDSLNLSVDRAHDLLYKILSAEKHTAKLLPLKRPVRKLWSIAAASVILLLLSVGGYFYFNKATLSPELVEGSKGRFKNDVAPGGNKAILTLSNGKQIILDSARNGTLTHQGHTKIIKLDSGQIAYNESTKAPSPSERAGGEAVAFNTITTPKGGQYQIILADGSKVWLNAASSLRYPTAFSGKERNVELTGEGYFEIAKNAAMPFHVKVNEMQVEVLGTHFNVNAYADENVIRTTLLEGSVKVSKGSAGKVIKPGEQAQIENHGNPLIPKIMVQTADIEEALAWKNGMFNFKGADIETVMRQVARWYDVEVVFEGRIPAKHYNGETSRNLNASQMLKVLEDSGIKFRIEGKKIIVM